MVRLSDELETATGTSKARALAVLVHDDDSSRAFAHDVLTATGATMMPASVGQEWLATRYAAPYLRDALLAAGALAETLETATFWADIPRLYERVGAALTEALTATGTPPAVLCHVSHVYPTGASLYFTVACAQAADPVAQWHAAKDAATRAIAECGATITHHHGVGTDHAAAYADEIGPVGLAALRAVKATLDPAGILNPGILLPL
jgi:alkyldihydroxyacetonephosphate synthase